MRETEPCQVRFANLNHTVNMIDAGNAVGAINQPVKGGRNFQNLTGKKYGNVTVLGRAPDFKTKAGRRITAWICQCDCGSRPLAIRAGNLTSGRTKSCGCTRSGKRCQFPKAHGVKGMPEHRAWYNMHHRCRNPKNRQYYLYGGRGIEVCERWREFEPFLDDMGRRPSPRHSLERKDNSGNYDPENCIWATPTEQSRNTRRNKLLTVNGTTKCISEWAIEASVSKSSIRERIKSGWAPEAAVFTPRTKRSRNAKGQWA